jgi:hypothetical protein
MTEMKATPNTFYDLETPLYEEEQEQEQEEEMLEMWLEKLNRPGRLEARGGKEVTKEEILKMFADEREQAMAEIMAMSAKEFQTRLFDGTLPDFVRETFTGLYRDTCHSMRMLTERDFELNITCYGDVHRGRLRYASVDNYKSLAYDM